MNYAFNLGQLAPYLPQFLDGLKLTLVLGVQSILLSMLVGAIGAIGRHYGPLPVRIALTAYVEVIRNTPLLVQIFVVFFTLPSLGLRLDPETAGLLALVVNGGAYMTEILRAGIISVPVGQVEAAKALGLKGRYVFIDVVCLPSLRTVYPAIASQCAILMLNTSICSQIAVNELTATANTIDSSTFRSFEVYVLLIAVYILLSIVMGLLFRGLGKAAFRWQN